MANVIKYYLDNGNIPDYVIIERNGEKCAGLWPNTDMALVGLGNVTGTESGVVIFTTKDELIAYMQTYMYNAMTPAFNYDNATTSYVPWDIAIGAAWLWDTCAEESS
jgi:hypothetical protein